VKTRNIKPVLTKQGSEKEKRECTKTEMIAGQEQKKPQHRGNKESAGTGREENWDRTA
jgi:hypothetical protein